MRKKPKIGTVKKQDILEKVVNIAYLSIGSNLGDRKFNIEKTKYLIIEQGINIINCSSFYETQSWPNPKFPKFLNIVIKINTNFKLHKLFIILKKIEKKMGRKKTTRNYPRVCDIDIVDYNNFNLVKNTKINPLIVPHPRMHTRNFVLIPLFEINNNWIHPKNKRKISKLISNLSMINISAIKLI